MDKRYLIIYHKEDNDGLFSMAIIYNYLIHELHVDRKNIDLFGADYNDMGRICIDKGADEMNTIDKFMEDYTNIIMTDISFNDANVMKKLHKKLGNNFCWIDHHAPIIKESFVQKFDSCSGLRDTHRSAILNAYKYFYDVFDEYYNAKNKLIELFRILSAWDSFTFEQEGFELDYVRNVNEGVNIEYNLKVDNIIRLVEWIIYCKADSTETYDDHCQKISDLIEQLYLNGNKYNTIQNNRYGKLCSDYGEPYKLNVDGRNALALFMQEQTSSMIFTSVKDKFTNGIVFKHKKDGTWSVSLYNTNCDDHSFHCGDYMKKNYGGGGHEGAAGAQITESQFIKILKTKTL